MERQGSTGYEIVWLDQDALEDLLGGLADDNVILLTTLLIRGSTISTSGIAIKEPKAKESIIA
jgi:hypothetical protein